MKRIHKNIAHGTRQVRNSYRDQIETIRRRVELLEGQDRALMTMYLENGNSLRQIAQLLGVNQGTVGRRIQRLTKRLLNSEYLICRRNRERFSKAELKVARDYFAAGLSIRKVAARRGYSYYRVRKIVMKIRDIARSERTRSERTRGSYPTGYDQKLNERDNRDRSRQTEHQFNYPCLRSQSFGSAVIPKLQETNNSADLLQAGVQAKTLSATSG